MQLARLNFHAFVSFDNVHFKFSDELKIYQKMQTLLADREILLQALIDQRRRQWDERFNLAKRMVAQLMIDCGANDFNRGLRDAVFEDHIDIVQLMIDYGATNSLEYAEFTHNENIYILLSKKRQKIK